MRTKRETETETMSETESDRKDGVVLPGDGWMDGSVVGQRCLMDGQFQTRDKPRLEAGRV